MNKADRTTIQKRISLTLVALIAAFLLIPITGFAGTVSDQLKGTLDSMIAVMQDPALQKPAQLEARRQKLQHLISERFDEHEIARRALGSNWKKLSEPEQKEFTDLFGKVLKQTYFKKIDAYLAKSANFTTDSIKYTNEKIKSPYAVVATLVKVNSDIKIPVHYRLKLHDKQWRVIDIVIEGVSIVKIYRAQFSEIIADSSFQKLMEQLKMKKT